MKVKNMTSERLSLYFPVKPIDRIDSYLNESWPGPKPSRASIIRWFVSKALDEYEERKKK